MTDLPPGLELDKLVAEAIGLPHAPLYGRMWRGTPDEVYHATEFLPMWAPSSLWRDAMLAAERSGLFLTTCDNPISGGQPGKNCTLTRDFNVWRVQQNHEIDFGTLISEAPTGPHAICLAILKLKEQ